MSKKKKRRAKFVNIKAEPGASLARYDYRESLREIERTLKEHKTRIDEEWEMKKSTRKFVQSLQKSVTDQIQDLLDKDYTDPKNADKKVIQGYHLDH